MSTSKLDLCWTSEAQELFRQESARLEHLREEALDAASLIGKVTTPDEQSSAIAAQLALKIYWNANEEFRVKFKEPALQFGRAVDAAAKKGRAPVESEQSRIGSAVNDYVAVQETKRRAEEALRLKELADQERRKQEELAKASSVEKVDEIQQRFNDEAKALCVPIQPVRAEGQIVRDDWEIQVTDIWSLAKAHPNCVSMQPRLMEIKQLLNAGVRPPGIEAKRVMNSSVRTQRRHEPLRIA